MEDTAGIKVTRRRKSVEPSDDSKTPTSTPTKKRTTRLAAKPQLELIDENTQEITPKRTTRKSTVKDVLENGEEKPVTPSRRSARIRSNTSLTVDTPQLYDSPRAKRAARRTSQIGSDSEAPSTPTRQTRRTRKDSTSSIDKQNDIKIQNNTVKQLKNVIEENESINPDIKEVSIKISPLPPKLHDTNVRKSPRLNEKTGSGSTTAQIIDDKVTDTVQQQNKNVDNDEQAKRTLHPAEISKTNSESNTKHDKDLDNNNLSSTSANLIKQLDTKQKNKGFNLNKSASDLDNTNLKTKRHRTKSWTILPSTYSNEGSFYSDNEGAKQKIKRKDIFNSFKKTVKQSKSGDGILSSNGKDKKDIAISVTLKNCKNDDGLNSETSVTKGIEESTIEEVLLTRPKTHDKSVTVKTNNDNKKYVDINDAAIILTENKTSDTAQLFEKPLSGNIQSVVYFEDTDSNLCMGNLNGKDQLENEDQCVPVVSHKLESEKNLLDGKPDINNISCEPMDIDETLPENVSMTSFSTHNNIDTPTNKSNSRNSSSASTQKNHCVNKSTNKAQRKASLSQSDKQNLENTDDNQHKSTLILSQLKDDSTNETNNISQSPKTKAIEFSKSVELVQNKNINKNLSLTYSTSTPLQLKNIKKSDMQINTSMITPNKTNIGNTNRSKNSSKENSNDKFYSSETSEENGSMLDDEAEEASTDYESGDSQNESDRQYADENEIVEKGETLTTEEEFSNDSDYEKDSFLVSSNEEDNELLSGSSDDLSMSDKELTMSAKSKKKYNERKLKQQKKASREMFEARHRIKTSHDHSNINSCNDTKRKSKRLLESSDSEQEVAVNTKIKNRRRLDSSQNLNVSKSDLDESAFIGRKKKIRHLSESICDENETNEKEITAVLNESAMNKKDPLSSVEVKQEPKTPQIQNTNTPSIIITNELNIEEVHINENKSLLKLNETSDPLQASSSDDDNQGIIKQYDSVLNELNNESKQKKLKYKNVSLDLNRKIKQKSKDPVIDQLNLTCTKTQNKPKVNADSTSKSPHNDKKRAKSNDETYVSEESSDSIDMRLLFPESSNDSTLLAENNIKTTVTAKEYIPLKKTEACTNIPNRNDNNDLSTKSDSALYVSMKKNKKNNSSQNLMKEVEIDTESDQPSFFIDTKGTHDDLDTISMDISKKNSGKKKKNKDISHSMDNGTPDGDAESHSDDAPVEKSFLSEKNRSRNEKSFVNDNHGLVDNVVDNLDASVKTSGGEKKKKKLSVSKDEKHSEKDYPIFDNNKSQTEAINTEVHTSKKRKRKLSANQSIDELFANGDKLDTSATQNENENISQHDDKTTYSDASSIQQKKKKISHQQNDIITIMENNTSGGQNKKLKVSQQDDNTTSIENNKSGGQKKKKKISQQDDKIILTESNTSSSLKKKQTKSKFDNEITYNEVHTSSSQNKTQNKLQNDDKVTDSVGNMSGGKKQKPPQNDDKNNYYEGAESKRGKKRKRHDGDDNNDDRVKVSKILKENSFDKVHVPRLPNMIIDLIDEKPKQELLVSKKAKIVSTSQFVVEETKRRQNKPSQYLEESVYLNDDSSEAKMQKLILKKPKVLPFVPTASTSGEGFTTNFKVNIIPRETKFVAQSSDNINFKNDYLYSNKIKRLGTYEMYKKSRNIKMSKF